MSGKSLKSSEWLLVGSLLVLMASLLLLSRLHEHRAASQLKFFADKMEKLVTVTISGAVLNPGKFATSPEALLRDVIKKSKPKFFANLRPFGFEESVEQDRVIEIAELTMIQVYVSGAIIKPVEMEVPITTRLCDLKSKIQLTKNADQKFMKRRRVLRDGDKIIVPEKINKD